MINTREKGEHFKAHIAGTKRKTQTYQRLSLIQSCQLTTI